MSNFVTQFKRQEPMIDTLITSKTRIKLLLRFFLNSNSSAYLRELSDDFDESTNSIRVELNRFEKAGLLTSNQNAKKKIYKANIKHPLFRDIHNILLKHVGLDHIINKVIKKLGQLRKVFVLGSFAKGMDSSIIDLLFVGNDIDRQYLISLVEKAEEIIKRRIRYIVMNDEEADNYIRHEIGEKNTLLLWETV